MKAQTEKISDNRVALTIEVDAAKVDEALERAYRKVVREVNIPGFRKGKVPRQIIEARFGEEVFYEDALEELVPEAYEKAIEENGIDVIDQPQFSDVHIEAGSPLRFKAEVDIMPEAKLGEYKGLAVDKEIEMVEESDIDHMLEHLQEDHAQLVSVDRDEVQEGDFATIDFEGYIDDEPFQGGAAKGYTLEIGSGQLIPGFEEQLVGAKVGSDVEVKVTFPEDYHSEDLAGVEAVFKVRIDSLKVREVPELDDEFAADVSDAKTLEELRQQIREDMESAARTRAEENVRNRLTQLVTDASEVEVPKVLVDREVERTLNEFVQSLYFRGIDPQQYLQQIGQTIDDLREEFVPGAEKRVKANLVLHTIVKHEGITVTPEEIEAHIEKLAGDSPGADDVRKRWEDPEQRAALESGLKIEKAIDLLVAEAQITEKEIPSQGHGHHHHHHEDDGEEETPTGDDVTSA